MCLNHHDSPLSVPLCFLHGVDEQAVPPADTAAASAGASVDLAQVMSLLTEMKAHMRRQDAAQRRLENKLETLVLKSER